MIQAICLEEREIQSSVHAGFEFEGKGFSVTDSAVDYCWERLGESGKIRGHGIAISRPQSIFSPPQEPLLPAIIIE